MAATTRMQAASERVGQFFFSGSRLEFTEFGAGSNWVVLLPGQLMPRRMHQHLARALAEAGHHVLTLDLLGHGRSDRPSDPTAYSVSEWGRQVCALLDHHHIDSAVLGGTALGANVSLEVAATSPERVRGLILEMPVLDNALSAQIIASSPLLFAARMLPWTVSSVRRVTRMVPRGLVPFWAGIVLDSFDQRPPAMAATLHGMFFGRLAPGSRERERIDVPALVVGHTGDPIHPATDAAMLAEELVEAEYVAARNLLEWRISPERLDRVAVDFVARCFEPSESPARKRLRA